MPSDSQLQVIELEKLRLEVAELRERLGRNSGNSSQPPSASCLVMTRNRCADRSASTSGASLRDRISRPLLALSALWQRHDRRLAGGFAGGQFRPAHAGRGGCNQK
jgi:hypothetical protein